MKIVKIAVLVLVIIGALNWGLVGIFKFDLAAKILGPMSTASRVVYGLVGIAAIVLAVLSFIELKPKGKLAQQPGV